jgi:DNA-binding CsgD family transcriptional regulator
MSVLLSETDLANLEAASTTLLSSLAFAELDAWRSAVSARLCELLGGDGAIFGIMPLEVPGVPAAFSAGYDLGPQLEYAQRINRDGGRKRSVQRSLEAFNQTLIVAGDWAGYRREPNVNEFLLPARIRDAAGLNIGFGPNRPGAFLMVGRDRRGTAGMGDKGLALLRLLLPSFKAGVEARARFATLGAQLARIVDGLPIGVLVADSAGRSLHESAAYAQLLASEPERDRLHAQVLSIVQSLAVRLRRPRATDAQCGDERAGPDARREIRTMSARYSVSTCYAGRELTGSPCVLVSLERRASQGLEDAELSTRFRLSPREVQVARLLSSGRSNKEMAGVLGTSVHTARRHTEHVLVKLGVRSRAAVGALLRDGARQS